MSQEILEIGEMNGRKWLKGVLPLNKKTSVYVNTITGEGVDVILEKMAKFISYKAYNCSRFMDSAADAEGDIALMILEAIPYFKYNENTDKNLSVVSFLQMHVGNRLKNSYKKNSEMKRQGSWQKVSRFKYRCSACKRIAVYNVDKLEECFKCGEKFNKSWKRYNIVINTMDGGFSRGAAGREARLDVEHFIYPNECKDEHTLIRNMDIISFSKKLKGDQRKVMYLLIQGHNIRETAEKLNRPYKEIADIFASIKEEFANKA